MVQYAAFAFDEIAPGVGFERRQNDRRKVTHADIELGRAEGYEAGKTDALVQEARLQTQALNAIARMMQLTVGRLSNECQSLREDAVAVAHAASHLVAGQLLDKYGGEQVENLFAEAAAHLRNGPRIVVQVAPELVEALGPRLEEIARAQGVEGSIIVRGDASAKAGDCLIEWADGAIHHDRQSAFDAIDRAAKAWLASTQSSDAQLNLFNVSDENENLL